MLNQESSRSHTIFTLTVQACERIRAGSSSSSSNNKNSNTGDKGKKRKMTPSNSLLGIKSIRRGKLTFVDLSGSERLNQVVDTTAVRTTSAGSKTKNRNQKLAVGTKAETGNINKSLFTLGTVITALAGKRAGYIPYRNSKLTALLKVGICFINEGVCLFIS
jgi:kinesin family protein 3/17